MVGEHDQAIRYLRQAIALAGSSGAVAHEARAQHDLARALSATGRRDVVAEAKEAAARASELAGSIGLVLGTGAAVDDLS